MFSFWEKQNLFNDLDIVIIGAGYTGLSAALHIKKRFPNRKVNVLEQGIFPSGASTKNAGFACFGSLSEIIDDFSKMPKEDVLNLVEKRFKGIEQILRLIGPQAIDFERNGSFELFGESEQGLFEQCKDALEETNIYLSHIIGDDVFSIKNSVLKDFGFHGFQHAIFSQYEGQLNPVKLLLSLLDLCRNEGVEINFGLQLASFNERENTVDLCLSNDLLISCKKLLFASNGFSSNFINLDLQPARAQVLITEPLSKMPFNSCFHIEKGYYYFRNVENRILLGGGRNLDFEGEKTTDLGTSTLIQSQLLNILTTQILPGKDFEIDQTWSGIMAVGQSKKPIVKKLSDRTYCAVRLGGMGVAIGLLTGQELANLIH
ncbi:MAG: FAD-dependent oxidoreductase [Bacteroidota bacterium]